VSDLKHLQIRTMELGASVRAQLERDQEGSPPHHVAIDSPEMDALLETYGNRLFVWAPRPLVKGWEGRYMVSIVNEQKILRASPYWSLEIFLRCFRQQVPLPEDECDTC